MGDTVTAEQSTQSASPLELNLRAALPTHSLESENLEHCVTLCSVTQYLIASGGQVWWVPAPARPPTVSSTPILSILGGVLHGPFVFGLL